MTITIGPLGITVILSVISFIVCISKCSEPRDYGIGGLVGFFLASCMTFFYLAVLFGGYYMKWWNI